MEESRPVDSMESVYLLRHVNDWRHLVGVYRYRANAVAEMWDITNDLADGPEGSEEWDLIYYQYEIVEMPLL